MKMSTYVITIVVITILTLFVIIKYVPTYQSNKHNILIKDEIFSSHLPEAKNTHIIRMVDSQTGVVCYYMLGSDKLSCLYNENGTWNLSK